MGAQLDLMRQMIETQSLRIDELEQQAEARRLEDDQRREDEHARRYELEQQAEARRLEDDQRREDEHARRLNKKPAAKKPASMKASDFDSMKSDNAVVTLGKNSDVAFVRTGAKKAAFVGDISFAGKVNAGDLSASSVKLAKDLTANGRVTTKEINIKGGIRVMDDLVLSGPNHKDPGTVGYTYGAG